LRREHNRALSRQNGRALEYGNLGGGIPCMPTVGNLLIRADN